jgi:hypothetical protein
MTEQQTGTIGEETAVAIPQPLHLYELAPEYEVEMQRLLALDTSTTEGMLEAEEIGRTLELLGYAIEQKVDNTAAMIANFEGTASALSQEIDRLVIRRSYFQRQAASLRSYLFVQLKRSGLSQIDGPRYTAAIRLNPEAVQVLDQAAIPRRYIRVEISESVDKTAIKAARKAGETVPGVEFTRGERLEIR